MKFRYLTMFYFLENIDKGEMHFKPIKGHNLFKNKFSHTL